MPGRLAATMELKDLRTYIFRPLSSSRYALADLADEGIGSAHRGG
jgi:hypothetical protein